jgi:hypothetical protein
VSALARHFKINRRTVNRQLEAERPRGYPDRAPLYPLTEAQLAHVERRLVLCPVLRITRPAPRALRRLRVSRQLLDLPAPGASAAAGGTQVTLEAQMTDSVHCKEIQQRPSARRLLLWLTVSRTKRVILNSSGRRQISTSLGDQGSQVRILSPRDPRNSGINTASIRSRQRIQRTGDLAER